MGYTVNDVDKIAEFKTWTDKQKMDCLLEINSNMYCNLGTDSNQKEKQEVKKKSRKIYQAIKKFDYAAGNQFLNAMDNNKE